MIEAIYEIGKIQEKKDFLEEFIDDIGDNYKHVFKIVIDISDINKVKYLGIEYEEYDNSKKMKYFYKKGSSNGPDKTPTSKITQLDKTINTKIKPVFKKFLQSNCNNISAKDMLLLKNIQYVVDENLNSIKNDILNTGISLSNKEGGVITFVFQKNGEQKYVGEMDLFVNVFKQNENEAYSSFFRNSKTESKAKDKYCYICRKKATEVWGFVNTYNFYTADKESYIAGGFKQRLMWKNYPVCPDCAKTLERGKKYLDKNLVYKFCGFNYYLIPQLIFNNEDTLKNILFNKLKRYTDFSLSEKKSTLIEKTEERILRELSEIGNYVNFNFLFFEKTKNVFKILLNMREIAPTRLKYLIDSKDRVDLFKRNFPIFSPIKIKKDEINLNFSFNFIREFFPDKKKNNKIIRNYYFLSILNDIFIGNKIQFEFLLSHFMQKIRSEFLNEHWIEPLVLKSYKIILYLEEIKLLERRKGTMQNYENDFEKFFSENPIFDDDVKKALFLEGVLVQKLLNIQYQERSSTPFRSRLNGLKIDEKVAKRLLPEIINKLEEYGKNYYRSLEEAIAEYLIKSDFKKYSVDEMSYYFTLGMILEKHF